MESLRILLAGLIDYAGLFPPAALSTADAVREYAEHRAGPHAWALGRFVIPVARLGEFTGGDDWRLSALAARPPDVERIMEFNRRGGAGIESVEWKGIPAFVNPSGLIAYYEVPLAADLTAVLADIARAGARAKVRTGGVTPEAFPSSGELARFIVACRVACRGAGVAGVAFKATAGLHHPLCGTYPLTYEKDSPSHTMHGFLNVFLAAAFIYGGMDAVDATELLEETSPAGFRFTDGGVAWRGRQLDCAALERARREFAISFGSCSFRDPVAGLKQMGLL